MKNTVSSMQYAVSRKSVRHSGPSAYRFLPTGVGQSAPSACGGDEWPKLDLRGGGRIPIQQNTLVAARPMPRPLAAGRGRAACFTSGTPRGFTLLEMIVSVGIFSVIMLLATGAYLTLINLNRQIQATDAVVTNLSFVLESMARNVRTGSHYCVSGCTASSFSYADVQGRTVTYFVDSANAVARTIGAQTDELTDPKMVTITALRFYPRGYAKNDGIQPSVTMVIRGTATAGGKSATFIIQTGATQRIIDL